MNKIECPACHAMWSENRFSVDCPICGGGALERNCPVCDGACGGEWRRAIQDSFDSGEAHWVGACAYEWWLDEPALPELRWAFLRRAPESFVVECESLNYGFTSIDEALAWLSEEEFMPFKDAIADGLIPPETNCPQAAP